MEWEISLPGMALLNFFHSFSTFSLLKSQFFHKHTNVFYIFPNILQGGYKTLTRGHPWTIEIYLLRVAFLWKKFTSFKKHEFRRLHIHAENISFLVACQQVNFINSAALTGISFREWKEISPYKQIILAKIRRLTNICQYLSLPYLKINKNYWV